MPGLIMIEGVEHTHDYPVSPTNVAIGLFDMVDMKSDGTVGRAAAGSTTVIGIAAHSIAASTGGFLKVYDNPNIVFRMDTNDANFDAQTDFGLAYDIVDGAPVNGRSVQTINVSTGATTATLPIKPLRLSTKVKTPSNVLGAGVLLDCQFNQHYLKAGSVGI